MMEEARLCYISGSNISTLIIALSCIERMLVTALSVRNHTVTTLDQCIKKCRSITKDPEKLLDTVDSLRKARNGYVHRQCDDNENRRVNRATTAKVAPGTISENDAFLAIKTMYKLLNTLMREASHNILENLDMPNLEKDKNFNKS